MPRLGILLILGSVVSVLFYYWLYKTDERVLEEQFGVRLGDNYPISKDGGEDE